MATKVHDQADKDFAEIDIILAQAKLELRRDRKLRRNMNLSDIPENFAHVPSSEHPTRRSVSLDSSCSQPNLIAADAPPGRQYPQSPRLHKAPNLKLHVLGLTAPVKWLRSYMSCLNMAGHDAATCDVARSVQPHPQRSPVADHSV